MDRYNNLNKPCDSESVCEKMDEYIRRVKTMEEKEGFQYAQRQGKKLSLTKGKRDKISIFKREIEYINLSRKKLNAHQDSVPNTLKLGPKHILDERIDLKDVIRTVENILDKLLTEKRTAVRNETQPRFEKKIKDKIQNSEDRRILREVKNDEEIACIKTDKTGKIAILDKQDYIERMMKTIEEMQVETINSDPNIKIKNKVKTLLKDGNWPNEIAPKVKNFAPNTIKDHKKEMNMRPIVSKHESPTYEIEKYIKNIFENFLPF